MTSDESCVYYPQYCFHLSRTIDQWCPLRVADIHELHALPAHQAQGIFFLSNHPIAWVRIAGVIVAVDYFYGRFIYTVDDSSGRCIECALELPKTPAQDASSNGQTTDKTAAERPVDAVMPVLSGPPRSDYDVGMVVIIKGSLQIFRGERQLNIHKMQAVKSTEQEVQFWNKIRDFRKEFLSQPWALGSKELEKCRAEYLRSQPRKKASKQSKAGGTDAEPKARHGRHALVRRDREQHRAQE